MYKHILIAIDLHPACDKLIEKKAMEIAKVHNAKVSIVHAIEHMHAYGAAQAYSTAFNMEEQLRENAEKAMKKVGKQLGVSEENQVIEIGVPKSVILQQAEALNADLIVVGSHGRHGFGLLLGATANGVLHGAKVDVLAVRVSE